MAALRLVIGNKNYSSWSMRPWLVLRHFGIEFEEIRLLLDTQPSLNVGESHLLRGHRLSPLTSVRCLTSAFQSRMFPEL